MVRKNVLCVLIKGGSGRESIGRVHAPVFVLVRFSALVFCYTPESQPRASDDKIFNPSTPGLLMMTIYVLCVV
jgi:hypothetical protein